ncbi:MAG: glycosyltransferase family 8 protein [Pontiellaceae bacterium]|nr:glycosyltransferase family 8 protein [Pontiellaceae bacterium]MBN2783918.1 glycosyltransferase family 8 protein [Pontiellaceae bacterium]
MDKTIKLCLAADANYMQHLVVTMSSVLIHADESDSIHFLVLSDGSIDAELLRRTMFPRTCGIDVVNAAELVREHMDIQYNPRWAVAAYYRLILPDLCPDDERIIYLDCDIVVRSSLAPLWMMDMDESIAGVADTGFDHRGRLAEAGVDLADPYINSGVTVWNLKKMRYNDYSSTLQQAVARCPVPDFPDQDWINIMSDSDRKILPPYWNAMSHFFAEEEDGYELYSPAELEAARTNPGICHFTNVKPWTMTYTAHPFWPEYWSCLKQTGFSGQCYKGILKRIFMNKPHSAVLRFGRMLRG